MPLGQSTWTLRRLGTKSVVIVLRADYSEPSRMTTLFQTAVRHIKHLELLVAILGSSNFLVDGRFWHRIFTVASAGCGFSTRVKHVSYRIKLN